LRFEEFTDEWEIKSLKSITDRLTRKNKNLETNNPLTISAQQGLISQTDFFNKVIASDNLKDYYLLKKGEFAYNKSYSNEYPYGAIKRLDLYNEGAISTLYICFTVNDYVDSDFLTIYFESDKWYKEIYKIAVEGARNHGLLNIGVNDFFNTKHNIPSLDEQKKISSFLMAVDKKLKLLNDKKTNFLKFKKYLLQNMFPQNDEKTPKLRFEEFTEEWEIKSLKSITDRLTRKNKNLETNNPLTISAQQGLISQTDFFNKVIASDNLKDYYLLKKGEFAYNKSYSNEYPYGAIKRLDLYNEGAISTLYICFTVNDYVDSDFLTIYFESDKWYKEIYKIAVEGARNHGLLNIGVNDFFNTKHNIPSLDEQKKISSFLMAVDKKIDLLDQEIEYVEEYKKGLLQKMFI